MTGAIAVTGAGGFLGWHTRVRAHAQGVRDVRSVRLGPTVDAVAIADAVSGAERVLHLAGVNRGRPRDVREANLALVWQLAAGLRRAATPPATLVYANSTQAGNGTEYGLAKAEAAEILAEAAAELGADFVDVRLPNLFGEHGRPFYNSVVATFCHQLARGEKPTVSHDRELVLLHAQDAAEQLLTAKPGQQVDGEVDRTVSALLAWLSDAAALYHDGQIPVLADAFDVALFNTYRSFTFPDRWPVPLVRHADHRGSFVETLRAHGSSGQLSYSTTVPGVVRGQHYHLAKVERFVVVAGQAQIALRRVLTAETVRFPVSGGRPVIVDMPTLWAHNITNTGPDTLVTLFWTNDLFDPARTDTYLEQV